MTRKDVIDFAMEYGHELVFYEPPEIFDPAILGVVHGNGQEPAVLYDLNRILHALAKDLGWEGAIEWFDYNTFGTNAGEGTPRFLITPLALVLESDSPRAAASAASAATESAASGRPRRTPAIATHTAPRRRPLESPS
jgi:hypothetical protein